VVVVNWDHEGEDFIAAFDKRTGKELWRNKREEATTWSTPLIVVHGGTTQAVVNATTRIRSYELHTGKQVWEAGGMTQNVIPTPVTGFDMVYALSGFRGNALLAIKLGKTGDLTDTDAIAWKHSKSTPYVPSPLLYGERLYFVGGNNAMLSCFNAKTGQAYYEAERLEGMSGVYASPIGASGRVYLPGRDGSVAVLKDSDKFEVLAMNKLDDKFDASAAAVGNQLFLRGHKFLYCIAPTERAEGR
jgi:outer membrane protein assembly factor BamB